MLLQAQDLRKEYHQGDNSHLAVEDSCLEVKKGEFISIIGRSGSGKSTFLNMIAGLIEPTSGTIKLEEYEYAKLRDRELSELRNTKIGYIPQGRSILSNFNVLDNVLLPFYLSKQKGNMTHKALELLERVGLIKLAYRYPAQLSGGELRRVTIARALINSPGLIIADEPTGDLDVQTAKEIIQLFSDIVNSDTSVLMVTHDLNLLEYSSRVFSMTNGKLKET